MVNYYNARKEKLFTCSSTMKSIKVCKARINNASHFLKEIIMRCSFCFTQMNLPWTMKLINVIPFRLTNDVKLQQIKLNVKYVSLISSNIHSSQSIEVVQNCKIFIIGLQTHILAIYDDWYIFSLIFLNVIKHHIKVA